MTDAVRIPPELEDLAVEVDAFRPFPANAREGDIGELCRSLRKNGQYRPIVANLRKGTQFGDMTILAGNHTWQAVKALKWTYIAATFIDVDDATARRIALIDNRSNDLATYDDDMLAQLLVDVVGESGPEGLEGTGFDGEDLDRLLADISEPPDVTDGPDGPQAAQECPACGFQWRTGPDGAVAPVS